MSIYFRPFFCIVSAYLVVPGSSPVTQGRLFVEHQFSWHPFVQQAKHRHTFQKPSTPRKPDLQLSPTSTLARCFIGPWARLLSGICHQSVPSLSAKVGLFGLIRGALLVFSQVTVLLNQEHESCFPWQTQDPGCPELPLQDDGREGGPSSPSSVIDRLY